MSDFDIIWDEFNEKLFFYIKSKVSNEHDAEDILQSVFMKVFKHLDSLGYKEATKAWLYQITRNSIIDFYKKKKAISVEPQTFSTLIDDVDEIDNMNDEIVTCLRQMIFVLPD